MNPGDFLGWFLQAWLAASAAIVAYRILTGRISLNGLITIDGSRFSPERLQLILITIGILASYTESALSTKSMPALPSEFVAVFAASQVLYLGGKIAGR
jgi:hypothetical protein